MANKKITAMSALGATPDTLDVLPLVDVSDVSNTATGETVKVTVGNLILNGTQTLTNKTLTDCDASTQTAGNDTTKIATTAFVTNLTSVGTIGTGVWQGTAIDGAYVDVEGTEVKSTGESGGTKFLREDGDGTCSWATPSGSGTVTSVATSGTVSGITLTGGPITGSGTVTLGGTLSVSLTADVSGTLPAGNGGTGLTAITTLLNSNTTAADIGGVIEDLGTLGAPSSDGEFIVATGAGAFAYETGNTVRTSLGLAIGSDVEAYNADIAKIDEADEWTAAQNFNNRSLTFDATQDWNLETDQVCDLTLTNNTTFDAPTNMNDGGFYSITIIQDSTGSRTAAWNAVFKWAGGSAPTLTTTATTGKDIFVFRSDGTNMYEVGRQLDLK